MAAFFKTVLADPKPPKVFSISYGIVEEALSAGELNSFTNVAASLLVQGVTIVAASGDDGAHYYGARYVTFS